MFLLGLFMWLNFLSVNAMYIYWPVVLIGITVIVLFLPARVLYHRSRKWWAYSNVSEHAAVFGNGHADKQQWRLLLAGLYPVEFRDFFLGDMYCSQTYAMGVSVTSSSDTLKLMMNLEYRAIFLSLCQALDRSRTVQFFSLQTLGILQLPPVYMESFAVSTSIR